jgi:hypothetical protein
MQQSFGNALMTKDDQDSLISGLHLMLFGEYGDIRAEKSGVR